MSSGRVVLCGPELFEIWLLAGLKLLSKGNARPLAVSFYVAVGGKHYTFRTCAGRIVGWQLSSVPNGVANCAGVSHCHNFEI